MSWWGTETHLCNLYTPMNIYTFGQLNRRISGNLSVTKATLPRTFSMSEGVKWDKSPTEICLLIDLSVTLPLNI